MTIGSVTRPFDTDLTDPQPMLTPGVVGSITLAPDKNAPCHCANCVVLATEVERLRRGNRALLGELTTANDVIRSMETKINMEGGK
jgi:hypothetical protein